jgi:hypothetical protein
VTSDSIAARVALVTRARRLILLKSTDIPGNLNWADAGRQGLVDPYFSDIVNAALGRDPQGLEVQWINFRSPHL